MALTDEQRVLLDQPLDPKMGAFRKADRGRDVSYIEGHLVIAQANRIFGFDAWSYSVDRIDLTYMNDGRGLLYSALVTVNVEGCGSRQDTGCHPIRNSIDQDGKEKDNVNNPEQHDLARKSAVTDALKRAFRSFGDQFGNSLYDKDSDIHQAIHEAVREEQRQQRQTQRASVTATGAAHPKIVAHGGMDRQVLSSTRDGLEAKMRQATTQDILKAIGRDVKLAVEAGRITDEERSVLIRIYSEKERELAVPPVKRSA